MIEFLDLLWKANVDISLLLIVILLCRFALRKTTQFHNAYLLWLSIPLALVCAKIIANLELQSNSIATTIRPITQAVYYVATQPTATINNTVILGIAWAIVSFILLARLIKQHHQVRQELRSIRSKQAVDLSSSYPVIAVDDANFSPAVYGFLKPKIYFPVQLLDLLTHQQISLILRHEEQHILQKHLWLNLLWDVLACFMWFNPLIYLSRQRFRHDQELYCDYLVLHKTNKHEHRTYGHALLTTVSATHSVSLLCSWKTFNQLEERIMNIKSIQHPKGKLVLGLLGALIVFTASAYSVATAHDPKAGEPPSAPVAPVAPADQKVRIVTNTGASDISKHIVVNKDDVQFIDEDGKRSVMENGEKREMTDAEVIEFEKLVGDMNSINLIELKNLEGPREIAIRKIIENGVIKDFNIDTDFDIDTEEIERALSAIDIDAIANEARNQFVFKFSKNEFEGKIAEHELEKTLARLEALNESKQIEKKQLKAARKKIELARKDLKRDREQMRRSEERARSEVQKLRAKIAEIESSRAR